LVDINGCWVGDDPDDVVALKQALRKALEEK
ncbi:hypothetical protein LCGC14_2131470, partial [marine sediment metagenome]